MSGGRPPRAVMSSGTASAEHGFADHRSRHNVATIVASGAMFGLAWLAIFGLGATTALAQSGPPGAGATGGAPKPRYTYGDGDYDPAAVAAVPLAPITRSYIPEAIDLSPRFPPAGNQGELGACVSWSTTYAARSYYALANGGSATDQTKLASPAYIHGLLYSSSGGTCVEPKTNIIHALEVLKKHGAVSLSQSPASPPTTFCTPTLASDAVASAFRITGYTRVASASNKYGSGPNRSGLDAGSLDRFKQHLAAGNPVLISFLAGNTFQDLKGDVVYDGSIHQRAGELARKETGWHAMAVTGYDDSRRAFRLINSWGKDWGNQGYGWIAYDTMLSDARYAYTMVVENGPVAPVPSRPASTPSPVAGNNDFACADIEVTTGVDGKLGYKGFVSSEADRATVAAKAASITVGNDVELRPWPICEALLTLREPLRRPSRPSITLVGGDRTLKVGERYSFQVTTPDQPGYLYVVYIEDDGTVVNLLPRRSPLRAQLEGRSTVTFGDGKSGRPTFKVTQPKGLDAAGTLRQPSDPERGHEAVIAIAARAPIDELEELEGPDSPVFARKPATATVTAASATGAAAAGISPDPAATKAGSGDAGPPDRLYLSRLRDIVTRRAAPDTLPREVSAFVLHLRITD